MNSKKIKIIYAITSLHRGGAERLLVDLLEYLDKDKYDPQVITVVEGGELEEELKNLGIPVKIFRKKTKVGLRVIYEIYKFLKKEKPDIFHSMLFGGDTWGRIAAIFSGVPHIFTTEQNINLDEGFLKKFTKMVLSWFTEKVIAISESVKNYSIKADRISPDKITVIYNGTRTEKFLWENPRFFFHDPVLISVIARLEPQKGHKYLLRALAEIRDLNWRLQIVGEGSLRKKLEKQAAKEGIKDKVEFMGLKKDISKVLKNIDIFVLPSAWEGLGIVVLEAAMAARPIVASKTGGIPEIINEETGWLVPPKKPKDLAAVIKEVLENKKQAAEKALRAQKDVKERFNIKNIVKQYEKLYENFTNK